MRVGPLATASGALTLALLLAGCEVGSLLPDGGDGRTVGDGADGVEQQSAESGEPGGSEEDVMMIVDDGTQVRDECAGREVVITADDAQVVLEGSCELVRATGRGSTVEVGSADKIVLVGVDNTVSYAEGDPEVVNRGRDTTVAQGDGVAD